MASSIRKLATTLSLVSALASAACIGEYTPVERRTNAETYENLSGDQKEFLKTMMPHALRLEKRARRNGYSMPAAAILAQWDVETGTGAEGVLTRNNNPGGITCDTGTYHKRHQFCDYETLTDGTNAYYDLLTESKHYKDVIKAQNDSEFIWRIGNSPWDESPGYAKKIWNRYHTMPLADIVADEGGMFRPTGPSTMASTATHSVNSAEARVVTMDNEPHYLPDFVVAYKVNGDNSGKKYYMPDFSWFKSRATETPDETPAPVYHKKHKKY